LLSVEGSILVWFIGREEIQMLVRLSIPYFIGLFDDLVGAREQRLI